jgi:hypothetical protein
VLTSRGPRRCLYIAVYCVGLVLGALTTGAAIWVLSGLLAPLPSAVRLPAVLLCAAIAISRDFALVRLPLPENRRLVPQRVFERSRLRGSAQFGFEMGTGVRTYVPSSCPYLLLVSLALLAPGAAGIALAAGGFALGRATVPWLRLAVNDELRWIHHLNAAGVAASRTASIGMALLLVTVVWRTI